MSIVMQVLVINVVLISYMYWDDCRLPVLREFWDSQFHVIRVFLNNKALAFWFCNYLQVPHNLNNYSCMVYGWNNVRVLFEKQYFIA